VEVGAYVPGTNRTADLGLAAAADINAFLQQDMFDTARFDDTTRRLRSSRSGCMSVRNPLRRLLRLREIREDQARAALAAASEASRVAAEVLEARTQDHEARPGFPDILSPAQLRGLMLQGVRSHEVMAAAADAYDRALGQTRWPGGMVGRVLGPP